MPWNRMHIHYYFADYIIKVMEKGAFVVATNSSWGTDNARPEDAPLWCAIYDSLGVEGF